MYFTFNYVFVYIYIHIPKTNIIGHHVSPSMGGAVISCLCLPARLWGMFFNRSYIQTHGGWESTHIHTLTQYVYTCSKIQQQPSIICKQQLKPLEQPELAFYLQN